jgi:hypothetical protein
MQWVDTIKRVAMTRSGRRIEERRMQVLRLAALAQDDYFCWVEVCGIPPKTRKRALDGAPAHRAELAAKQLQILRLVRCADLLNRGPASRALSKTGFMQPVLE